MTVSLELYLLASQAVILDVKQDLDLAIPAQEDLLMFLQHVLDFVQMESLMLDWETHAMMEIQSQGMDALVNAL